jgi:hypothetical protein
MTRDAAERFAVQFLHLMFWRGRRFRRPLPQLFNMPLATLITINVAAVILETVDRSRSVPARPRNQPCPE